MATSIEDLMEDLRKLSIKELQKRVKARTVRKRLEIEIPNSKGELVHLLAQLLQQGTISFVPSHSFQRMKPKDEEHAKKAKNFLLRFMSIRLHPNLLFPFPTLSVYRLCKLVLVFSNADPSANLTTNTSKSPTHSYIYLLKKTRNQTQQVHYILITVSHKCQVDLRYVKQFVVGQESFKRKIETTSTYAFSIIYSDTSLDVICEDEETWCAFVSIINYYSVEKQR